MSCWTLTSDLEGNFIVQVVLPACDFLHFLLYVFLHGSFHVDVIAVSTGVVAGDGLDTQTRTRFNSQMLLLSNVNTFYPIVFKDFLFLVRFNVVPCGSPSSGSFQSRESAAGGRRRCRPSPSPGGPWVGPGRSRALRGTSCSRHPEDTRDSAHAAVFLRAGVSRWMLRAFHTSHCG